MLRGLKMVTQHSSYFVLGNGPGVLCLIPSFGQNLCLSQHPHRIPMLNKGVPPHRVPSLWGIRVQTESLRTAQPGDA